MAVVLSNGVDLDAMTPDGLAALVLAAQLKRAGVATADTAPDDKGLVRVACILSPYTQACTRCGTPGGQATCEEFAGLQFAATLTMRARKRA